MRVSLGIPPAAGPVPAVVVIQHGPGVDRPYEGAGHAFLNFTNPSVFREGPAADAWGKLFP